MKFRQPLFHRIVAFTVFYYLISSYGFSTTYHFSQKSGDDNRSTKEATSPETPWQSLKKLNEILPKLRPGDSLLLKREEVFFGKMVLNGVGSMSDNIYIGPYGNGDKPTVSGMQKLGEWEEQGKNVYVIHLDYSMDLQIVSNKRKPLRMGRFPNDQDDTWLKNISENSDYVASSISLDDWEGAEVVIRKNQWIIDRHYIESQEGEKLFFKDSGRYPSSKGYGFFIQNHINTLAKDGDWYFDKDTRKLYLYSEGYPDEIWASVLDQLVENGINAKYLTIEGIKFEGANQSLIALKGASNITFQNCEMNLAGKNAFQASSSPQIRFLDNLVSNAFNSGVYLVQNSYKAEIRNNRISEVYLFEGMGQNGDGNGMGINATSDFGLIKSNILQNIGYSGIVFGGHETKVMDNYIADYCLTKNDGGGIYSYTGVSNAEFKDRQVSGNVILNGRGDRKGANLEESVYPPQVEGIYLDDNASGVLVKNNKVVNVQRNAVHLHNARNIHIDNNFLHGGIKVSNDDLGSQFRGISVDGNKFIASTNELPIVEITSNEPMDWRDNISFSNNQFVNPTEDKLPIKIAIKENEKSPYWEIDQWLSSVQKGGEAIFFTRQRELIEEGSEDLLEAIIRSGNPQGACKGDGCMLKAVGDASLKLLINDIDAGLIRNIGNVESSKSYGLRITTELEMPLAVSAYFRRNGDPWNPISMRKPFQVGGSSENEIHITPMQSLENVSLIIDFYSEEGLEFLISGMEFVTYNVPEKNGELLIFSNMDKEIQEFNFEGKEHLDLFTGSVSDQHEIDSMDVMILIPVVFLEED
ncbi:right-handed parallel beta-helix repeat-containing protein [Pleomorphovibrio marinus]|uniref:right-handed parallel beta-helix repeat-containing protein n=1 Tax=Pleomorphovibrio marinus TaxID=2164132 RepID=UPI000E0B8A78|nr:right-handed parallel beta-helix repeat-containing protein [Pleomorphovibrio marinus]